MAKYKTSGVSLLVLSWLAVIEKNRMKENSAVLVYVLSTLCGISNLDVAHVRMINGSYLSDLLLENHSKFKDISIIEFVAVSVFSGCIITLSTREDCDFCCY